MRFWDSKLRPYQIRHCVRRGHFITSQSFGLRAVRGEIKTHIILIASKKALNKRAVIRNFAKRRIRAALDRIEAIETPMNCALLINRHVLEVNFQELVEELHSKLTLAVKRIKEKSCNGTIPRRF